VSLGKCVVPVLLQQSKAVNNENMLDDPVVGSVFRRDHLHCFVLCAEQCMVLSVHLEYMHIQIQH
jgi:hypothetical protein